jgi:hypothetical protein
LPCVPAASFAAASPSWPASSSSVPPLPAAAVPRGSSPCRRRLRRRHRRGGEGEPLAVTTTASSSRPPPCASMTRCRRTAPPPGGDVDVNGNAITVASGRGAMTLRTMPPLSLSFRCCRCCHRRMCVQFSLFLLSVYDRGPVQH